MAVLKVNLRGVKQFFIKCSLFKKATRQNQNSSIGIFNLTFIVKSQLNCEVDF